jgi:predicted PurR-regulated permease PerM
MAAFFKELLFWIGLGLVFYGIYQIYIPASFIVCGLFLLWLVTPTVKLRQKKVNKTPVLG